MSEAERFYNTVLPVVPWNVRSQFREGLKVGHTGPIELIKFARTAIVPDQVLASLEFYDRKHPREIKISLHHHTNMRRDDGQEHPWWLLIELIAAGINHVALTGHDTLEPSWAAQRLIDEFGLPVLNYPSAEINTWGNRHLLAVGAHQLYRKGLSLNNTMEELSSLAGNENILYIGAHPNATFFSLTSRQILEQNGTRHRIHAVEYDTTWGRRTGGVFSGVHNAYERELKGKTDATPLLNPDTHDDYPWRAITYVPEGLNPLEAIRRGQATSEIIHLGGRLSARGSWRFVTASGWDLGAWAKANIQEAILNRHFRI